MHKDVGFLYKDIVKVCNKLYILFLNVHMYISWGKKIIKIVKGLSIAMSLLNLIPSGGGREIMSLK